MSSRAPLYVALAITATHLLLAGCWIVQHELPTGGRDEFFIVEVATDIAYRLGDAGWDELRPLILDEVYYPPLVRLPGVLALWLGGGYDAMVWSGWLWLPFLLGGTWVLGRDIAGGPWGGVVALALLLPATGLVDCIHRYESNLGVMAMSACALAAWVRSEHFRHRKYALLFGLFLGLGLLADRLGLLPFVLLPCLVSALVGRSRATWVGLGIALGAALVTALWWYWGFFGRFGEELMPQLLQGEIDRAGANIEARPGFLFWWLHYLIAWPDSQFGLVGGLLALGGLGWGLRWRGRPEVWQALVWIVGGILLFSVSQKRQVYYTLPLLPPAAALAAGLLLACRDRLPRAGTAVVVGLLVLVQIPSVLTVRPGLVDVGPGLTSWLLLGQSPLPESVVGERFPVGGPPSDVGLDMDHAFELLQGAGLAPGDRVAVFSSAEVQVTEHYQVVMARMARQALGVYGLTTHPEGFLEPSGWPAALLFIHRGEDPWPSGEELEAAHHAHDPEQWAPEFEGLKLSLTEWRSSAELLEERDLADSDRLAIWRLTPRAGTLAAPEISP